MRALANAVGYQAVWIIAVTGAAHGRAYWALAAAAVFVAAQWLASQHRASDLRLLAVAVALGVILDGTLAASGWLRYATPDPALLAPAWILAVWAAFALTINHSLRFLQGRPAWAAAVGALGGPAAYLAAERGFGAVTFATPPARGVVMLAVAWALVLALLGHLAQSWQPVRAATAEEPS
ncbi:DUF2878 domain-containing protein [Lysobacter solisilvae (ex Woo and Kim 2020)]|uniref:DUF2878 domain-containing protein n=1 Tax=Agrilutibacter terrestris TaxID=2865112 RepID=A0A7H0G0E2_9GAMM|nr:DUF2878 domain-containing protein [Lysobacter terrestris]QNP41758.1 DUF2878 domain-containing protein [Lysobacter terrestris]